MKKFIFLFLIAPAAFAQEGFQLSEIDKAVLNVAAPCQGVMIDIDKYNQALAALKSPGEANLESALGARFDQQKYNAELAAGKSVEVATELAMTYRYSNNSKFCRDLRSHIRAELER